MTPDYKAFALWALQDGPWAGCDLDGGAVQDAALKFGIIKQVEYDPQIHGEETICVVKPGDRWYVLVQPS